MDHDGIRREHCVEVELRLRLEPMLRDLRPQRVEVLRRQRAGVALVNGVHRILQQVRAERVANKTSFGGHRDHTIEEHRAQSVSRLDAQHGVVCRLGVVVLDFAEVLIACGQSPADITQRSLRVRLHPGKRRFAALEGPREHNVLQPAEGTIGGAERSEGLECDRVGIEVDTAFAVQERSANHVRASGGLAKLIEEVAQFRGAFPAAREDGVRVERSQLDPRLLYQLGEAGVMADVVAVMEDDALEATMARRATKGEGVQPFKARAKPDEMCRQGNHAFSVQTLPSRGYLRRPERASARSRLDEAGWSRQLRRGGQVAGALKHPHDSELREAKPVNGASEQNTSRRDWLRARMRRLRLPIKGFTLALLVALLLAGFLPARGLVAEGFDVATTVGVMLLFFLHGAKLSRSDIVEGITHWRLHLVVLAFTFAVFPLLGLALKVALGGWLSPALLTGLIYLTALPSTVQSSIAFTSVAGGNVAAAICAASLSNLAGVFLTPALVTLLIADAGAGDFIGAVLSIVTQILLPFALGHFMRPLIGKWVERSRELVSYVDRGAIVLIVYAAFSASVVDNVWSGLSPWMLALTFGLSVLVLFVVLAASWSAASLLGFSLPDRITVLFCASKKSMASGLPMARVLFAGNPALGVIVLPMMVFHQLQLMVCAAISERFAKRALQVDAAE